MVFGVQAKYTICLVAMLMTDPQPTLLEMTADIVSAYVSAHSLKADALGPLIVDIHTTLQQLQTTGLSGVAGLEPAINPANSITPEYLICLEDGKKLKMLKRYLRTRHGMSPEDYRTRWRLPQDYPMVAPNYAKRRSEFAKQIGLGRKK